MRPLFLVFLTKSLLKCPSSTNLSSPYPWSGKFLVAHLHSGICFAKRFILNVWQCPGYVSVLITAQKFVQWLYSMYSIRHIQNSGIFSNLFFFSGIWQRIKSYLALLRHINAFQNHVQHQHVQKPDILGIMEYLEPFHNCILTHSDPCHINKNWWIFRTLTYLKPGTYLEPTQRLNFSQK